MKQLVATAAVAASLVLVAPAAAITGFGAQFRIGTTVAPDEPNRGGATPHAANNPVTGETLVTWTSDQQTDNVFEVSGQMLAADGSDLGGDFVISSLLQANGGMTHDVAVDTEHDRYLVVYSGDDDDAGSLRDVWAVLYNGDGAALTGEVRVPFFVYGAGQEGFVPHAAYNPVTDQWLVTWSDNRIGNSKTEVYGRALDVDGTPLGTADLVISERSASYASGAGASYNSVAVSAAGEYFIAFTGTRHPDPAAEKEVWLQRLTSALAPTPSGTDVQVSDTTTGGAGEQSIAYDPTSGRFLIAYASARVFMTEGVEVFGRIVDGTGAFVTGELQLSNTPGDGSITHEADVAGGGGEFAVEFLAFVNATEFAPHVQELTSDGTMIDGDTLVDAGGFLFGDVVRSGDRWLGLYPLRVTASHPDVFARFSGTGGPPQPPPDDDDDPPANGGGDPPTPGPPAAGPPPPPSAVAPPPPPRPTTRAPSVALPAFARVVTLPSTRRCASRRNFRIRLKVPRGLTATSADVSVNGRRVQVVRGRRLTAPVDLRSLPKGRFTVKILVKLSDGRRIEGTRRYRTCAPKRRR
jgi:hypothetical protein